MLSKEENERLTQVGPGTPVGELMRRYWQPVCAVDELARSKFRTKELKVLDEEGIDMALLYPTLGIHWEGHVTDARLATYPGRSPPSKVWNSPQSSTVSNLRPKRSSWTASATANSTSIPRSPAFARAIAKAVSATSTPRTGNPSEAT